jgi:two-component system cell cycle response regulator DivK
MIENPTILVIEDYSDTRMLLSSFLRAHGFKVIEARDGEEGFTQANRVIPDLILMDLALPKMDGVEATRQIRRRQALARIPVLAISAYATGDVARDAIEAGCTEVFGKPFAPEQLLKRIHANLRLDSPRVSQAAGGN